jgi:hypothetical protein
MRATIRPIGQHTQGSEVASVRQAGIKTIGSTDCSVLSLLSPFAAQVVEILVMSSHTEQLASLAQVVSVLKTKSTAASVLLELRRESNTFFL